VSSGFIASGELKVALFILGETGWAVRSCNEISRKANMPDELSGGGPKRSRVASQCRNKSTAASALTDDRRNEVMKTIWVSAIVATFVAAGSAFAQETPPTENKGVSVTPISAYELSKQGLKDFDQRQMRIRQLKMEPGGVAALHSHAQRPAFTYVLSGTLLEHRKGAPDRTYKAGEVLVESSDVEHWAENKGSEPVMLVSVDLFKE
jgi:quercetin dioxygenase-like cupin family protein